MEGCLCLLLQNNKEKAGTSTSTPMCLYLFFGTLLILVSNSHCGPTTTGELLNHISNLKPPLEDKELWSLDSGIKSPKRVTRGANSDESEPAVWRNGTVCRPARRDNTVKIGNVVSDLNILQNCSVLEGNLQIIWMSRYVTAENFTNIQFPKLLEITGYLLFYRVNGISSIGQLFPNLRVIRAEYMFFEYALILYENDDLTSISLTNLGYIGGNIIAMMNPQLCYIDDHVNWRRIVRTGQPPDTSKNRAKENGCDLVDGCPTGCNQCWDMVVCQKECDCIINDGTERQHNPGCDGRGNCCHESCLGGCESPGSNATCYACRNVNHDGTCLDKCPDGLLEFDGRRCLTEDECVEINPMNKFHDGRCILRCPKFFTDHKDLRTQLNNPAVHQCVHCDGACDEKCKGGTIQTTSGSERFSGCTIVQGFLEIVISNVAGNLTQLEENLHLIREVTSYVKVVRSPFLENLNFLKSLRRIWGRKLDKNNTYAFYVMDNENLDSLWKFEPGNQLTLDRGKMFFQQNPRLCFSSISLFLDSTAFQGITRKNDGTNVSITKDTHDSFDVSESTNGQYGNCFNNSMFMQLNYSSFSFFPTFNFSEYKTNDERMIISYVLYYRPVAIGEVATYYRSRADCGTSDSVWQTIEIDKGEFSEEYHGVKYYVDLILRMDPYTRYAAYVQTFTTIAIGSDGAKSPIVYIVTKPAKPLRPRNIVITPWSAKDNIALDVKWEPPEEANGVIEKYNIYYRKLPWKTDTIYRKDFCGGAGPKIESKPTEDETASTDVTSNNNTGSCPCDKNAEESKPKTRTIWLAKLRVDFENHLQNDIFEKNPLKTGGRTIVDLKRDRREVDEAASAFESAPEEEESKNLTSKNLTDLYVAVTDLTTTEKPAPVPETIVPSMVSVLSNKTSVPIFDLEPNMEYSIEVVACHAYDKVENATRCSKRAIGNAITKPDERLDVIDSSTFKVWPIMKDYEIVALNFTWTPPVRTNGPILSYTITYQVVDEATATPLNNDAAASENSREIDPTNAFCVSASGFMMDNNSYVRKNIILKGGAEYDFRVRMRTVGTFAGNWTLPFTLAVDDVPTTGHSTVVISIALPVCFFTLLIVLIATLLCYRHKKKKPLPNLPLHNSFNPDYLDTDNIYNPDEWEIDRSKVKIGISLGQGSFGMVYEGAAKDLYNTDGKMQKIAIKTVNDTANIQDRINFLNEASRMKAFSCHHIVQLLGVVSQGQPVLVIMELMALGDLKNYLRMHRPDEEDNDGRRPPTLREILQMAAEIADGMAYLSDRKFVHRDLAARNCMVAADMTVKIGDFGMTRDIYDADYYRKGGKGMMPIRWMAPESLRDGVYTSKSDVWSYGVVLWEMATLAAQPYQGFSNEEVLKFVLDSRVMEMPDGCPTRLYTMMSDCWQYYPRYRPTFASLLQSLQGDVKKNFFSVSWYYSEREDEAEASENEMDSLNIDQNSESQPLHPSSLRSSDQHLDMEEDDDDLDMEDEDDLEDDLEDTPIKELVIDMPPPIPTRLNSYQSLPRMNGGGGGGDEEYQMMSEPLVNGHAAALTTSDSDETDESSECSLGGSPLLRNGKSHSVQASSTVSGGLPPPSYTTVMDQPIMPTDPSIWSTETNSKSNSCNGSANGHLHFGNTLTSAC